MSHFRTCRLESSEKRCLILQHHKLQLGARRLKPLLKRNSGTSTGMQWLNQLVEAAVFECTLYYLIRKYVIIRPNGSLVILVNSVLNNDSLTLPGLLFFCLTIQIRMIFMSKSRTSRVRVAIQGLFTCVNRPKS